jgi:hypothetical protein
MTGFSNHLLPPDNSHIRPNDQGRDNVVELSGTTLGDPVRHRICNTEIPEALRVHAICSDPRPLCRCPRRDDIRACPSRLMNAVIARGVVQFVSCWVILGRDISRCDGIWQRMAARVNPRLPKQYLSFNHPVSQRHHSI